RIFSHHTNSIPEWPNTCSAKFAASSLFMCRAPIRTATASTCVVSIRVRSEASGSADSTGAIGSNTEPISRISLPPNRQAHSTEQRMDIEGSGFLIGLIGAIWMKVSMNLLRGQKEQPELRMIGREPENPALKAF